MKVKIGKPQFRLESYILQKWLNLRYGNGDIAIVDDEDFTKVDKFFEKVEHKVQSFYNVFNRLWFDKQEQKVKVRIDRWDTWAMDETLTHIIVPMLKQLKTTKHGSPHVDSEDVPSHLQGTYNFYGNNYNLFPEDSAAYYDLIHKRWDWVMDEMIWTFEMALVEPNGFMLSKEDQNRMQNGYRLFGKYFQGLWD